MNLRRDVEAEFEAFNPNHWDRIAEAMWQRLRRSIHGLNEYNAWFRSTRPGKAYVRSYHRRRYEREASTPAAVRCCPVCRKMFTVSLRRQKTRRDRTCGRGCGGALGKRFEGKPVGLEGRALTIKQWARLHGLNHQTVHERLRRGWTLRQALETPAKRPGYVHVKRRTCTRA